MHKSVTFILSSRHPNLRIPNLPLSSPNIRHFLEVGLWFDKFKDKRVLAASF